jgi:hypothetical protein
MGEIDPMVIAGWLGSLAPVLAAIVIWGRRIVAAIRKDATTLDTRISTSVQSGVAAGMAPVNERLDTMGERLSEIEQTVVIVVEVLEQLAEESPKARARLAEIERRTAG